MTSNFKATAPSHVTKTKRDYYWFLPTQFDSLVSDVKNHRSTGYQDFVALKGTLRFYFADHVLGQ